MGNEKALQVFTYQGNEIRTFLLDAEIWWVANDLCKALDIKNTSQAIGTLDEDEKGICNVYTPGGWQEMLCVNEPGYYHLIFTSRKPEAKPFQHWVKHEVLPSIRKTGSYSIGQSVPQEPIPTISDVLRQRTFRNEGRVPASLFSIQCELTRELHYVEGFLNATSDNKAFIENSVGQCFSPYARNDLHIPDVERGKYRHQLPNGRIVAAWAYPIRYLPDFRRWLYTVYFPVKYPAYQRYRARCIGTAQALKGGTRRKLTAPRNIEQLLLFS